MSADPDQTRRALGRALRIARVAAGGTTRSIGQVIGKSHTHVQRVEDGTAPITTSQARAWLDATDADSDTRDAVLALVAAAAAETVPYRRTDRRHIQHEATARIEAADQVDTFQPHVVPGLLQTASYCRALGVPPGYDLEEHVAARLGRQAVLTSGRRFRFVLRGGVLTDVDPEQRAKVTSAESATVSIRLLDERPRLLATVGFMIYTAAGADTAVRMELPHGEHPLTEPADIAVYRDLFEELWAEARQIGS